MRRVQVQVWVNSGAPPAPKLPETTSTAAPSSSRPGITDRSRTVSSVNTRFTGSTGIVFDFVPASSAVVSSLLSSTPNPLSCIHIVAWIPILLVTL